MSPGFTAAFLLVLAQTDAPAADCASGPACFHLGQDLVLRALTEPDLVERELASRCPRRTLPEAPTGLYLTQADWLWLSSRQAELLDLAAAIETDELQLRLAVAGLCTRGLQQACEVAAHSALFAGPDADDQRKELATHLSRSCSRKVSPGREPWRQAMCRAAAALKAKKGAGEADPLADARARGKLALERSAAKARAALDGASVDCARAPSSEVAAGVRLRLRAAGQRAHERGCALGSEESCDAAVAPLVTDQGQDCLTARVCRLAGNAVKEGTEVNEGMGLQFLGRGCELGDAQSCVDWLLLERQLGQSGDVEPAGRIPPVTIARWRATPTPKLLEELCAARFDTACEVMDGLTAEPPARLATLRRVRDALARGSARAPHFRTLALVMSLECRAGLAASCAERLTLLEERCRAGTLMACRALVTERATGTLGDDAFARLRSITEALCPVGGRCVESPEKTSGDEAPVEGKAPSCSSVSAGRHLTGPRLSFGPASQEERPCVLYADTRRDPQVTNAAALEDVRASPARVKELKAREQAEAALQGFLRSLGY